MAIQNDPIYQIPSLYIAGLQISNNSTAPTTKLDIAAGQCRDSSNNIDIVLGSAPLNGPTTAVPLILDFTVNGVNGLDTGTVTGMRDYAIYLLGDSTYNHPVCCIATLATNSIPLIPFGYDSYRLIGYWETAGDGTLKLMTQTGNGSYRKNTLTNTAQYLNAGTSTSFLAIDLTGAVPPIVSKVEFNYFYTPAVAANSFNLRATGSGSTNGIIGGGAVAAVVAKGLVSTLSGVAANKAQVDFKVTASDSLTLNVSSYEYYL